MPIPRPLAILHIPAPALGGCVMAGVERDTRGCALSDLARFNYYPATPMAVVSWVITGELHMVETNEVGGEPVLSAALPRLILSGPQRRPSVSWSPGDVHALSIGFYPEALSRLLGQPVTPFIDRHVPLETLAPQAFLTACQAVLGAAAGQAFSTFEARFRPLWREPGRPSPAPFIGDWVRSLATRAVHSAPGKSLRQFQRRMRNLNGQSYRELSLFVRVEEAFVRRVDERNRASLAATAADAGFSDQSHMGRQIRRVTGFSPASFETRLAQDEAFWYYRLLADGVAARGGNAAALAG